MRSFDQMMFLVLIITLPISCLKAPEKVLLVATAANVQFAMKEVVEAFINHTGIECQMVTSSSGKIAAQIQEGAPFDVFLSADMQYPMEIYEKGFAWNPPTNYATGTIVFWSVKEKGTLDLNILTDEDIDYIAIANPKIAPYGVAAIETLEFYHLLDSVKPKLVYGENIAQVNQFILSGAAYGGFTAKAAVLAPRMAATGSWKEIDQKAYRPIKQGAVVLKNSRMKKEADVFLDFLGSNEAISILRKYGYEIE
ncbi:MAG: molybdate ABC transporter substrate-binding protein [Saprospiraceae bacterium]|nr:molybdate ABC transporter substrate-binding protein [Saprospiraceae bacterium]